MIVDWNRDRETAHRWDSSNLAFEIIPGRRDRAEDNFAVNDFLFSDTLQCLSGNLALLRVLCDSTKDPDQ